MIATMRGVAASVLALVERRADGSHALVHGSERDGHGSAVASAWEALHEQLGIALAPSRHANTTPHTWEDPRHTTEETWSPAHPYAQQLNAAQDRAFYYHYHSVKGNLRQWKVVPGREYVLVAVEDLRRLNFATASDKLMLRHALEHAEEVEQVRARAPPGPPPAGEAGRAAEEDPFVTLPSLQATLRKIAGPQHAEERHRLLKERLVSLLGVLDTQEERDGRGCTHGDLVDHLADSYSEWHLAFFTESRRALAFASGVGPPALTHRPEDARKLLEEGDHVGALRAALGPEAVPSQPPAAGEPNPGEGVVEHPPEKPPPAPAGPGGPVLAPGPPGSAPEGPQDGVGGAGASAGEAEGEEPDEDPYDWVASWVPGGMAANWVHTARLPTGTFTIRDPIPTSWVELWKPAVLQELGHFPPELAAWLDSAIQVEGEVFEDARQWIQFEGCPRSMDTHRALPLRLEDGGTETVYYHPRHMLLFFEEAEEVYRLMHLVQGPVPYHLRAHRDEQIHRTGRLLPPPLRRGEEPDLGSPPPAPEAEPHRGAPAGGEREGEEARPEGGTDRVGRVDPGEALSPTAREAGNEGEPAQAPGALEPEADGAAPPPEAPGSTPAKRAHFQPSEQEDAEPEPADLPGKQEPWGAELEEPGGEQDAARQALEPASDEEDERHLQMALEASRWEHAGKQAEGPSAGREEDAPSETREQYWVHKWRRAPRGEGFRHVLQVLGEMLADEPEGGAAFHLGDFSRIARAGLGQANGELAEEYLKDTFGAGIRTNTNPYTGRAFRIPEVIWRLQETQEAAMRRDPKVSPTGEAAPSPVQGGEPRSPHEEEEGAAQGGRARPTRGAGEGAVRGESDVAPSRVREATPEPPKGAILHVKQLEETD